MKNIIEFPDRKVIEQEAVAWLIKLDGDQPPSQQELDQLKEWLSRSPAHVEELESLGAFWEDLIVLTDLNMPLAGARAKPADSHKPATSSGVMAIGLQYPWAIAAGILLLAVMLQLTMPLGFGKNLTSSNGHYATAIGKQSAIPLADGSVIHLNTNSQVEVDYSKGYRNIRLVQGEAHFTVAKNKNLPFRVYAGKRRVEAIGTAFSVHLREKDIDVLVTEGTVELAAQMPAKAQHRAADSVQQTSAAPALNQSAASQPKYYLTLPVAQLGILTEGQGATILAAQPNRPDTPAAEVQPIDAETLKRHDAWRKGLLLFAGDTLEEVVTEISRYTTVSIEIADPALKEIRIGGQFRVGDLGGMFDVLEANFGLSITLLNDNTVKISAAEQ